MKAVAFAALLCACGTRTARPPSEGVPWAASGVDWSKPPAPSPAPRWQPPAIDASELPNGLRILVVENRRLPLVAITVVQQRAGAASSAAAVTALSMVRGTPIETTVATDHTAHSIITASAHLPETLEELARTIRKPSLDDASVSRVRDQHARELLQRRDRPRTVAAQVFDRVAFEAHPYGAPAEGTPETVATLTPADVRTFWQRTYQPDSATVILAGDVTPERARELVTARFGDWTADKEPEQTPPVLPPYTRQLAYVDTPGATEAVVIVGTRTRATGAPYQVAADVATMVLGGGTEGRLDRVLRAEKQYTFGASASFWRGVLAGSWTATATFRNEVVSAALDVMLETIKDAPVLTPTDAELAHTKRIMLRGWSQSFETVATSARAVERLVVLGHPLDWYATLEERLAEVDEYQVKAAGADAWRDLSIVIVGDWSKLRHAVSGVGLVPVAYTAAGSRVP